MGDVFTAEAIVLNLPLALALVAVTAEVVWLTWRGPRRRAVLLDAGTAAAMAGGALATGIAYTAILRLAFDTAAPLAVPGLATFWRDHVVLAAVATFVAWDAAGWAYHWIGHATRVGWAGHQPHHSATHFDLTVGLRQSWFPLHGLAVHPVLVVFGFDLTTIAMCASVSNGLQVLQHSAAVGRLPRVIEKTLMTPGAHRHHHAAGGSAVNLGPVFTVWDRLAGTWADPALTPAAVEQPTRPTANPVAIELRGWRDLVAGVS